MVQKREHVDIRGSEILEIRDWGGVDVALDILILKCTLASRWTGHITTTQAYENDEFTLCIGWSGYLH